MRIETGDKVTTVTFPDGPAVVATRLEAASRLLGRELPWPGARTALMDVAASPGRRGWPGTVIDVRADLRTCCLIDWVTATFPDLLGHRGPELFQAHLGIGPQASREDAAARIEATFDEAASGWRERVIWQRSLILTDATGAVDPPGATWQDRPAIDQGDDHFLAGDAVAAPGMLSEVAVNSGIDAARRAVQARRHRVFAPGWPRADLTPARRLAVLAAALPGASITTAGGRRFRSAVARAICSSRRIGSASPTGTGTSRMPTRFPACAALAGARTDAATATFNTSRGWSSPRPASSARAPPAMVHSTTSLTVA